MWSKQKVVVTGWQCFLRYSNRLYNSTIFFTNLCYFFGREKMSSPKINMFVSPLVPLSRGANGWWICRGQLTEKLSGRSNFSQFVI